MQHDNFFNGNGERGPLTGRSVLVRGRAAVEGLKRGVDLVVDVVGSTLGPSGRCVVIDANDGSNPIVTKDGVTVSMSVNPVEPVTRMGARLVREAASRTNEEAGDGTTTATVLTGALVDGCVRHAFSGHSTADVKRGLDAAVQAVLEELNASAIKVETEEALRDIATVSANGDTVVGDLVAKAVHKTGVDGVVTVENARSSATTLEVVEGLRFDRGYLSPYFVNDKEKMHASYEDCAVLVTDRKLSSIKDLVPLLEDCRRNGDKALLVIADEVDGDAMQGLVLNRATNGLKVVAVKLPGLGADRDAHMHDLIALVGGDQPTLSSGRKVEECRLANVGRAKRVVVDAKMTTVVSTPGAQERVQARMVELKGQLDDVALSKEEIDSIRHRLAKLSSGAAVVRVGGVTEVDLIERKYRIEDALHAAKAALEDGLLPGGGSALFVAKMNLEERADVRATLAKGDGIAAGWRIVLDACEAPLRRITSNAHQSTDVVIDRYKRGWKVEGWDAAKGEWTDLLARGIVDPAKVTCCALRNAASVAGIFMQLDAVIHEYVESKEE